MSDLRPKNIEIEIGGIVFPMACTLNVMDDLETEFGKGFFEIIADTGKDKGVYKLLKVIIAAMVNEGIEIANESGKQVSCEKVTERWVGRNLTGMSLSDILVKMYETISASLPEDDEEDPQTERQE